jgi:hypothetical protein
MASPVATVYPVFGTRFTVPFSWQQCVAVFIEPGKVSLTCVIDSLFPNIIQLQMIRWNTCQAILSLVKTHNDGSAIANTSKGEKVKLGQKGEQRTER